MRNYKNYISLAKTQKFRRNFSIFLKNSPYSLKKFELSLTRPLKDIWPWNIAFISLPRNVSRICYYVGRETGFQETCIHICDSIRQKCRRNKHVASYTRIYNQICATVLIIIILSKKILERQKNNLRETVEKNVYIARI